MGIIPTNNGPITRTSIIRPLDGTRTDGTRMDGPATETDMETTTDIWGEPGTGVMEDSEVSGFLSLVPIYTVL